MKASIIFSFTAILIFHGETSFATWAGSGPITDVPTSDLSFSGWKIQIKQCKGGAQAIESKDKTCYPDHVKVIERGRLSLNHLDVRSLNMMKEYLLPGSHRDAAFPNLNYDYWEFIGFHPSGWHAESTGYGGTKAPADETPLQTILIKRVADSDYTAFAPDAQLGSSGSNDPVERLGNASWIQDVSVIGIVALPDQLNPNPTGYTAEARFYTGDLREADAYKRCEGYWGKTIQWNPWAQSHPDGRLVGPEWILRRTSFWNGQTRIADFRYTANVPMVTGAIDCVKLQLIDPKPIVKPRPRFFK